MDSPSSTFHGFFFVIPAYAINVEWHNIEVVYYVVLVALIHLKCISWVLRTIKS